MKWDGRWRGMSDQEKFPMEEALCCNSNTVMVMIEDDTNSHRFLSTYYVPDVVPNTCPMLSHLIPAVLLVSRCSCYSCFNR